MGFGALSVVPQTYFDIIARIVPALILSGARFVGRLTEHMATDTETSDFFEELRCLFGRLE
jgi:hypothetical protein